MGGYNTSAVYRSIYWKTQTVYAYKKIDYPTFSHMKESIVFVKPHLRPQKGALSDQLLLAWHILYSSPKR